MGKKYFCSNFGKDEKRFFTMGGGVHGQSNLLTSLFKLVGKFRELDQIGKGAEILKYQPDLDNHFKYENAGYAFMREFFFQECENLRVSRKLIKNLSRKWTLSPIILHHESDRIIEVLFKFISSDENLEASCKNYLMDCKSGSDWMPIQHDFLSTRANNWEAKDCRKASKIIQKLTALYFKIMEGENEAIQNNKIC